MEVFVGLVPEWMLGMMPEMEGRKSTKVFYC